MLPFLLVYSFKYQRHYIWIMQKGSNCQEESKWLFLDRVHVWFSKATAFWGDRSHWKSQTLKPVPLLEAGLGFPREDVPYPRPPSPQQILQREPLRARSGVEVMLDLKAMSVSPARLVGLCWSCSRSRAKLRHDTPSDGVCSAPRTTAERTRSGTAVLLFLGMSNCLRVGGTEDNAVCWKENWAWEWPKWQVSNRLLKQHRRMSRRVCFWIDRAQMSMYDTHGCHQNFEVCTLGWNLALVSPSETCSGLFSCISCR